MYFKVSGRHNPKINKVDTYFRLVESFRALDGCIRQRQILAVGFLEDNLNRKQLVEIQTVLTERAEGKENIFKIEDSIVEKHINEIWNRIMSSGKLDLLQKEKHKIEEKVKRQVDIDSLKHKDVREVGSEWLSYQGLTQLRLSEYLRSINWTEDKIKLTEAQIISRAVYPASELKTSQWIEENSAVKEIVGYADRVTKDKLYENAKALYKIKDGLEQYLSKRTNELFDIEDKVYLFDLTNTYFEGSMRKSKIANYGRSKEKRNDAKIIVLGLVTNTSGFIKYSSLYEGNTADNKALPLIIDKLSKGSNIDSQKATIVIDAGIATEDNLDLLESKGYKYVCVSRSQLTDHVIADSPSVAVQTNNKEEITLQKIQSASHTDYLLKVKSPGKLLKEQGMQRQFEHRFEEGLETIKIAISKKNTTKKAEAINRRIGRTLQKYPSVSKYYDITTTTDSKDNVIELRYSKNEEKYNTAIQTLGIYFLRSNYNISEEKQLWIIYNSIREIESTFRCLKTDLDLRPIYHKTDQGAMAHLHLGLLAYSLVNTIRYQLKAKGINNQWSEIVRIGNTQKAITTYGKNIENDIVATRKCSEPTIKLKNIYTSLNYKLKPTLSKSVVLKIDPNFENSVEFRRSSA
jgi:Transposase DDE domain